MEKGAEGEETKSESVQSGGVLCGRRMQFEIGQIAFFFFFLFFFAHEAWYAPAGSLSRHKPDASTHTAAKESSHSQREKISTMK